MVYASHSASLDEPDAVPATTCYLHPDRETGLHCVQCERPICVKCRILAAVGQVCPACARARRPMNYQISPGMLILAAPVVATLSLLICTLALCAIAPLPVYVLYLLLPASYLGADLIGWILDRLTRAKRGRRFQIVVGISVGVGACPALLLALVLSAPVDLVLISLFAVALTVTTMRRLR